MRVSRSLWLAFLGAALIAVVAAAGQDSSTLPSAPSATLEQQKQKSAPAPAHTAAPAPASPPQQSSEAAKSAPVTESSDAKEQAAPQPASDSAAQESTRSGAPARAAAADNSQATLANDPSQTIIRSTVNEVNVVFTVTDKHNHYVKDLKEADFKVFDNKKPPASIRNFSAETNLPLRVGLLIDASNSIRDRFRFEQQAAIEFLNQIINPKRDLAFVLGFDTTPEITQDFTGSPEKLANGVRLLRPGGGTAMYDAIYGACRDKLEKQKMVEGGVRRAIILVSDGEDNQSRVTRDDAIEEAQRAEVIVYAISTNVSGTESRGDKILRAVADATGGRAFFPFKIEEVSDAFSQIQEELRSQYAISYKPADFSGDGRYRTIDIEAVNKRYKVRSRKGYFAPKAEVASAAGGE
jgi:Ca-activated chloride channel homolog